MAFFPALWNYKLPVNGLLDLSLHEMDRGPNQFHFVELRNHGRASGTLFGIALQTQSAFAGTLDQQALFAVTDVPQGAIQYWFQELRPSDMVEMCKFFRTLQGPYDPTVTIMDLGSVAPQIDDLKPYDPVGRFNNITNHQSPPLGKTMPRAYSPVATPQKTAAPVPRGTMPDLYDRETCPVCYDTGYYRGFGAPCSKGCKLT